MKIKTNILLFILFAWIVSISSCRKPEEYSIVPYIEYVNFTKIQTANGVDSKGILNISFKDGDGDIGLSKTDTMPPYNVGSPYYYNLCLTYYEKQHGEYVPVELPFETSIRIPIITPISKNKTIKGTIEAELFFNNVLSTFDTIAYDIFLYDRALHKSNVIRTPDIIVNK